ncbi:MAG: phosphoribosylglycinamide formyltransferase [Clostridiales bacterium]|nr:phosphoribosylglycinamide formyltransferase [Clostridiales bacterium]MBR0469121.1 phosphoribosylglycinamide formyltransferase [Mogibacterium sp.]
MSDKARIAVMVSSTGTNLQALIDAQKSGLLEKGEIALVISNREDAYAIERARKAGIETFVITSKASGGREGFEEACKELIDSRNIDLIVLAGFLMILSKDFVSYYDHKIINIHPALIPSFCGDGFYGLKPHIAALERGVKVTGATVHFVNEVADGGEIIAQKAVNVEEGDTPETLQRRVMEQAEWLILPVAVAKLCRKIVKERN